MNTPLPGQVLSALFDFGPRLHGGQQTALRINSIWRKMRELRRALAVFFLCMPLLVACAKPTLAVNLHGVNYSGQVFSYIVFDPNDPKNTGGSGLIDPYAAGGTDCCYELPKKWRRGLSVSIRTTHWTGKLADDTLRDVVQTHSVEVPSYADGKPGELWVLRTADGTVNLVSSDFQPDHPQWPGGTKGWPVPSLAYQRERWDLYIEHEKGGIRHYEKLLADLEKTPDVRAKEAWDFMFSDDKKSLTGYLGPEDKRFRTMLRREYEDGLRYSRQKLEQYEEGRP
jgi:hypothetical protein